MMTPPPATALWVYVGDRHNGCKKRFGDLRAGAGQSVNGDPDLQAIADRRRGR